MNLRDFGAVLLTALAASCTSGPVGPKAPRLAIVYTNNVDGDIEPCG